MDATTTGIVSGLGSSAAFVLLALALARTWLSARIKEDVRATYEKSIESHRARLRAEHERELERFRATVTAAGMAHGAAGEHRLEAVRKLWARAVLFRRRVGVLLVNVDVLSKEEWPRAYASKPEYFAVLGHPELQKLFGETDEIEELRPFVEEKLWALFFGYRALLGRIALKIVTAVEEGRTPPFWLDDPYTMRLLRSVLTPDEISALESRRVGRLSLAQSLIEAKMVEAGRRTISGQAAGEAAAEHARRILEAVSESAGGA